VALSNWDVLALDEKNLPTNGIFTTPLGITAEIYKSWVYVSDPVAWRAGGGYMKDIVMCVGQGRFTYLDLHVLAAKNHPDDPEAIFCACWSGHEYELDGKPSSLQGMVGIGTYGFADNGEWVGVRKQEVRRLAELLSDEKGEFGYEVPKLFRNMDFGKALRVNKGDMYFEKNAGIEADVTPVEEATKPTMLHIVEAMKEADKNKEVKPEGEEDSGKA
jgi:hypothetical protein